MSQPLPLNALLSGALLDLVGESFAEFLPQSPHLPLGICLNLLMHLPEEGADLKELPTRTLLSKRAGRYLVGLVERRGWVTVEGKRILLTSTGRDLSELCDKQLALAEREWRSRYGDDLVEKIRESLASLVGQLDLELPHYPAGYGPADSSITGAPSSRWGRPHARRSKGLPGFVFDRQKERQAAEAWEEESGGRIYVPTSGQDWRPVQRVGSDSAAGLRLIALLSQALTAFSIEYEGSGGMSLAGTANWVRHMGDAGERIEMRASRSRERGNEVRLPAHSVFAGLTRHAYATVEVDPDDIRQGTFQLTEKGRQVRDVYEELVAAIEQRWERRYGPAIQSLRASLEKVIESLPGEPPHHVLAHQWDEGTSHE